MEASIAKILEKLESLEKRIDSAEQSKLPGKL